MPFPQEFWCQKRHRIRTSNNLTSFDFLLHMQSKARDLARLSGYLPDPIALLSPKKRMSGEWFGVFASASQWNTD
jgi:hypothetical protein